jgi:hypothetical protein
MSNNPTTVCAGCGLPPRDDGECWRPHHYPCPTGPKKMPNETTQSRVRFSLVSIDLGDADEDMIAIPSWMLGVLAEELTCHATCGGGNDEPGCPRCDAIRTAKWASECGRILP